MSIWKLAGYALLICIVFGVACGGKGQQVGDAGGRLIDGSERVGNNVTDFVSGVTRHVGTIVLIPR